MTPSSPWRLKAVTVLPGHRLSVTFNDGKSGIVDMSAVTTARDAGVYAPLADPRCFDRACLVLGVVTWPGDVDLDPAWMHDELVDGGTWRVPL